MSYCISEKASAEALAEETSAKYMAKLEEKACSLRINVYSKDKASATLRRCTCDARGGVKKIDPAAWWPDVLGWSRFVRWQVKVLTASSEATMQQWVDKLEESVTAHARRQPDDCARALRCSAADGGRGVCVAGSEHVRGDAGAAGEEDRGGERHAESNRHPRAALLSRLWFAGSRRTWRVR